MSALWPVREGSVLVEAIAVGVCGTDIEIVEGKYGWAPQDQARQPDDIKVVIQFTAA